MDKEPKPAKPKQIRRKKRQPYKEITLSIDDTPENVAKAMFKVNPALCA